MGYQKDAEWLMTRVEMVPFSGCWLWMGYVGPKGYGRVEISGRNVPSHKAMLIANGKEIPAGLFVDHICRVRCCVNPAHLRIVTPRQNALENSISPPAINNAKTHCVYGHELSGSNLLLYKEGERICRECRNRRSFISTRKVRNSNGLMKNASGYRGVIYRADGNKYEAEIKQDGKKKYLGRFDSKEEAAKVYDRKALELQGRRAKTNFPRTDYEQS